jgi:phosphonate transport system substrate-binding protein
MMVTLPSPLRFGVSRSTGGPHPLDGGEMFVAALGAALGRALGSDEAYPVELKITTDYQELVDAIVVGRLHLAWMPPVGHAQATQKGARLLAVAERRGALSFRAALMVRKDCIYTSIESLRGARCAWTDPSSTSGYLYPRHLLASFGIDPKRDLAGEAFYGTARAALEAVAVGTADVCGSYAREGAGRDPDLALADAERILPLAKKTLRVLSVTDLIPPDGVVASAALAADDRTRLSTALLSLDATEVGAAALAALMDADRLRAPTPDVETLITRLRTHLAAPR